MEGDTPYKSFVQTETYTNEVHFAAYQKAFFFANSYPLWTRHCGLHSDRDGQHFKGANIFNWTKPIEYECIGYNLQVVEPCSEFLKQNKEQRLCPEANPTQSDTDSHETRLVHEKLLKSYFLLKILCFNESQSQRFSSFVLSKTWAHPLQKYKSWQCCNKLNPLMCFV